VPELRELAIAAATTRRYRAGMRPDAAIWRRQPGQGRYAKPERERRFLLAAQPPPGIRSRSIEDRYIEGTRLRLRLVAAGAESVYKLTQKVRLQDQDPSDLSITNTYLSPAEHAVISALPSRSISKTRRVCPVGEHDFVVDVFHGRLLGLRLAEVEVENLCQPLTMPSWIGEEITHDDRYTGGSLAFADEDHIRTLLARQVPFPNS